MMIYVDVKDINVEYYVPNKNITIVRSGNVMSLEHGKEHLAFSIPIPDDETKRRVLIYSDDVVFGVFHIEAAEAKSFSTTIEEVDVDFELDRVIPLTELKRTDERKGNMVKIMYRSVYTYLSQISSFKHIKEYKGETS